MKPGNQPENHKEDLHRARDSESGIESPEALLARSDEGEDSALLELLLKEAVHLKPADTRVGECLSDEQLMNLAMGAVVPGAWRHVARCTACRTKVLAGRVVEPPPQASLLQRLQATLSDWLALSDVSLGWKHALAGGGMLALLVIALRWDRSSYVAVTDYINGEAELASDGQLSASQEGAAGDGGQAALLEQARTNVRKVYPGGVVAFRLIGTRSYQEGLPPEVLLVLQPEGGGARRILEAQALTQGATLTVIAKDGQSWPGGVPLRVGIALGTDPTQRSKVKELLLRTVLPDSLAVVEVRPPGGGTRAGQTRDQRTQASESVRPDGERLSTSSSADVNGIDRGSDLACANCETGRSGPPEAVAESTLHASRSNGLVASASSEGEDLMSPGLHATPLPMKCSPLSIDAWWICDLPMRLKVQQ